MEGAAIARSAFGMRSRASASHDKTARLWAVEQGNCLHCFEGFDTWVWSVDFYPRGGLSAVRRRRVSPLSW
ncbi:MAG: hypothetical protein HC800_21705 [Phormidesmis sp. RL_2_1]|nr:hypothetical protein [Phormidesmis sp. RL_2_1]